MCRCYDYNINVCIMITLSCYMFGIQYIVSEYTVGEYTVGEYTGDIQ